MSKTVLITGGGRGIGAGIAEKLAAEGWNVCCCGRRSACEFSVLRDKIRDLYSVEAVYYQADISESAARCNLFESILRDFGSLEALVNNAGVAPVVRADLLEMSEESYDRVMSVNLKGPFFLTQRVGRYFAENNLPGTIINIGSISATTVSVNRGEYCLSKAGVAMATKLFAVRMAEFGVRVYEIRPGVIASDMTMAVKEKYDKLISEGLTLQARWGFPDDVGRAVAMLLRGDLAYSTGQVINVDGGMEIGRL